MAEYIEREAAVNVCSNQYKECLRKSDWCGDTVAWNIGLGIKALPTADVAPVVHGRWDEMVESKGDGYTGEYYEEVYYNCLNCDYATDWNSPYCPNCGARMDGE